MFLQYLRAGAVRPGRWTRCGAGETTAPEGLDILPGLCPHFVVHFVAQGLESSHHGADPAEHFLASTCLCPGQQCPLYTQIQMDRPFNRNTLCDLQKACFCRKPAVFRERTFDLNSGSSDKVCDKVSGKGRLKWDLSAFNMSKLQRRVRGPGLQRCRPRAHATGFMALCVTSIQTGTIHWNWIAYSASA